jgi:predicted TPR repeat methyltransferase
MTFFSILEIYSRFKKLQYIKTLFNNVADRYNREVDIPTYSGVIHMEKVFSKHNNGQKKSLDIIDLGCGTGICGNLFKKYASKLDGIDLSANMLKNAKKLNIYNSLEVADITDYLVSNRIQKYDLIISAGVFTFFNNLGPIFYSCARGLKKSGGLIFTVDRHDKKTQYVIPKIGKNYMFSFNQEYIEKLLLVNNFQIISIEKINDRLDWENREPVPGFVVYAVYK